MSAFLASLGHLDELWAMIQYKATGMDKPKAAGDANLTPEMKRCYELLNMTSRSFAAVIQALDDELRPAICIFYLVLRGLDTIGMQHVA
jgi:farnesyl-diphosphate farnesyltransferase